MKRIQLVSALVGITSAALLGAAAPASATQATFTYSDCVGEGHAIAHCDVHWTGGVAPYTTSWTTTLAFPQTTTTDLGGSPDVWDSEATGHCRLYQNVGFRLTVTDAAGTVSTFVANTACV